MDKFDGIDGAWAALVLLFIEAAFGEAGPGLQAVLVKFKL